tara:strand:+ start:579 stop:737 length:159 start_codon:yes stop_codon:yes gene_type:complete
MSSKTMEDIYKYEKQALDMLDKDHPHYDEVRKLLIDQINDEIHDLTYTRELD